jgi:16S rRNA (uracil1498-N3)-methyltransferase
MPDLPAGLADCAVEGDEVQHARVKRLAAGEAVHLFDGRGHLAAARVIALGKRALSVRIEAIRMIEPRRPRITVAASQPKGERLDWMLEKLTEVGVAEIWPLECERSVAHAKEDRIERWQRRVIEAAKQAHVAWLPAIQPSHKLSELLDRAGSGLRTGHWRTQLRQTAATPGEPSRQRYPDKNGLGAAHGQFTDLLVADTTGAAKPILAVRPAGDAKVLVVIGPEGGFSDAEREQMGRAGLKPISLGASILRTETAAVVAASCLLAASDLAEWDGATGGGRP